MTDRWTVHTEIGRLFRPIYNLSGEPCFEWDRPGGPVTRIAREDRDSSVTPRQRSTSASTGSQPREMPYRYPTQLADHATRHDGHNCQPALYNHTQNSGLADGWSGYPRPEAPKTGTQPRLIQSPTYGNSPPSYAVPVKSQRTNSLDWGSSNVPNGGIHDPSGRRPTKMSLSEGSDATASSRSNASSPKSIAEDLRGLSLGDHVSSQLIPPHGTSPRSQRWDPILGDVQRNHDSLVRLSLEPAYVIPGSTEEHETLDPRYKRQSDPRRFFRVGRVFAMLWHENAGLHGTILSQRGPPLGREYTKGKYQEPIYSSIRRMVVVKEQKGCCWCIPITTYGGKGVAKAGLDRSKHAVIYMRGCPPVTKAGEPKMTKEPLEVEPAKPDQKLDPMSRLNFGKVYTVEHNVKILSVGRIIEASMAKFIAYTKAEFTSK